MKEDPSGDGERADATTVRLLHAASDAAGGDARLALRLRISPGLLADYLAGRAEPPRHVMLGILDLLMKKRESQAERQASCGGGSADGVA